MFPKLIEGQVTAKEAAEKLGLSERQVKRLRKGVGEEGPVFLIHKNTGCKPVHVIPDALVKRMRKVKITKMPISFTSRNS